MVSHTLVDADVGADGEGEGEEGEYGANVNNPAMRHVGSMSKLTIMGFSTKEGWQPSPAPVIITATAGGSSPQSGHEQKSRFIIKGEVLGCVRFFVHSFMCLYFMYLFSFYICPVFYSPPHVPMDSSWTPHGLCITCSKVMIIPSKSCEVPMESPLSP